MEQETNNIVKKSNTLIDAHYNLGINEQKIIYYLVSLIKVSDKDFKTYEIKMTDVINFLEIKNNRIYKDIKKYTDNLMKQILIFKNQKEEVRVQWLSMATYRENGIIIFRFAPELKQHLLKLKERFTMFNIKNILKFNSKYSPRIYEYLKKFEKLGQREITIDDLRQMLMLGTSYKSYNLFKKRILLVAQEEINYKTDISFIFKEIKEGKKVVRIIFYIKTKKINKQIVIEQETSQEIENLVQKFNKKYSSNMKYKFMVYLVDEKGIDIVEKCIDEFDYYVSKANEIEKIFFNFVMRYGTDKAYTKTTSYKQKPVQATNYEQRKYDDDFFYSLYDNLTLEEVRKINNKG